jgi:DNA replication protein DnaC
MSNLVLAKQINSKTGNDQAKPGPIPCHICGVPVEPEFIKRYGWLEVSACDSCNEEALAKRARIERREKYTEIIRKSNLPQAAMTSRVSFKTASRLTRAGYASEYAASRAAEWRYGPIGIYFYGPAGSGKTHIAQCMLKRQAWLGSWGLFLDVPSLLMELRNGFSKRAGHVSKDWVQRARRIAFLVLDDLGAEKPTEWSREIILSILNARMGSKLPTIITSNNDLAELHERLGDPKGRIASRIAGSTEPCEVQVLSDGQPVDIRMLPREEVKGEPCHEM